MMNNKHRLLMILLIPAVLFTFFPVHDTSADEFSIIRESSIIGYNYGAPTGIEPDGPIGKLGVVFESAIFIKNLEISQLSEYDITGETFIQSITPLRFYYKANQKISMEAGIILGYLFGNNNEMDITAPLMRVVFEASENVFIVAGTIFPTHFIHDALLDDIRKFGTNDSDMNFNSNVEQGFQFRMDKKRIKQDLWINWKIREEQERREEFDVASTTRLQFFNESLFVDFQIRSVHIGGQKNILDEGVDGNLTLLGGVSYGFKNPFGLQVISDLRFGAKYMQSSDDTLTGSSEDGDGFEVDMGIDMYPADHILLRINCSHFQGSDFYSRGGDPFYTLDDYSQFGIASVFSLNDGLVIETGAVAQQSDDALNFTFMVNVVWGHAFFCK